MLQCKILFNETILVVTTGNIVNKFRNCYFIHESKAIHVYRWARSGVSKELPPGTTAYCDLRAGKLLLALSASGALSL